MSIEKYTTKCLVITSFDQNENDRVYKLFTREFGLLIAHAKSIRKLESKLRSHILPRTVSLVTLVKGKEVWRLVGAEEQKASSVIIHEVTELISRFIHGEEPHIVLYDRVEEFLRESDNYDKQKVRILFYYILLVELGYADVKVIGIKNIKEYRGWNIDDLYTHFLLSEKTVKDHIRKVVKDIQL
ncbi:MAG: recombination protein O N-terminal domain-containing protein [Candidatus Nomurabacteria bacterium]